MMRINHTLRSRANKPGQQGFTLLEVIVAITLLGIIMVPLAAAFITAFRTSGQVKSRLDRNGDVQRITEAWTRDVQGVDSSGVHEYYSIPTPASTEAPCVDPDPSAPAATSLITFISSSLVDAGTPRKVTWYTRFAGLKMELVRSTCVGDVPSATGIDVLADSFGVEGGSVSSLIHGINGAGNKFCTGLSCSIAVRGSYEFDLTVARRVPNGDPGANALARPPTPVITGVTGRDGGLTFAWLPPSMPVGTPPITSYQVEVLSGASGPIVGVQLVLDANSVGADIGGLTNGTPYWVRVRALNVNGESAWAIRGPTSPAIGAPSGPTVLSITPGDTQITASWSAVSGATNYRIYAQDRSGREIGPVLVAGSTTTGTIGNLINGVEYQILISVITPQGEGERGPPSGWIRPFGEPPAPERVLATPGDRTITVDWDLPQTSDDPYINGNGRPITGIRVGIYAINPDGTRAELPTWGFFERPTNINDAEITWIDPTQARLAASAITNGRPWAVAVGLLASSDAGVSGTGARLLSQPAYEGAATPPGVTPSGPPTQPNDVSPWEIFDANQLVDMTFRAPDGGNSAVMDQFLNGAPLTNYKLEVAKNSPKDSATWINLPALDKGAIDDPLPTRDLVEVPAGAGRPTSNAQRVIPAIGPLEGGGTRHRFRIAVANRSEVPGSPLRWSVWSSWGGVYDQNTGSPGSTNIVVSRPANSFGTELNVSWTPPSGTITTYRVECRASSGTTITRVVSAPASSTLVTGLTDGRNYSCTVQAFNGTTGGGIAQSGNTDIPFGQCTLVAGTDTFIDDENGNQQGSNSNLGVARNGSGFLEFGAQANRRALIRWNYANACTNGLSMAGTAFFTSANLSVTINDGGTNRNHRVNLVTSAWSDSTTWGSRPAIAESPGSWWARNSGTRTINVLSQARFQRTNAANNNGWQIRDDGGDPFWFSATYASRENGDTNSRPRLAINFFTQGP